MRVSEIARAVGIAPSAGRCDVMGRDLAKMVAERRADVARRRAELEALDAELCCADVSD